MIRADDGSTAFPARVSVDRDDSNTMRPYQFANNGFETPGMSLRDHFAGMAMAAMIGAYPAQAIDTREGGLLFDNEAIAYDAYEVADAMLKARKE